MAETGKIAGMRFDYVIKPFFEKMSLEHQQKLIPKVVSMFKDRADQIKSIKASSAALPVFNQRFDLNAPDGFAANGGNSIDLIVEFKKPQQVIGFALTKPTNDKFIYPSEVLIYYKPKATDASFQTRFFRQGVHYHMQQAKDFELRRKFFGIPHAEVVKVSFVKGRMYPPFVKKAKPLGGRFDLMLSAE